MKNLSYLVGRQVLVFCLFLILVASVFFLLPVPMTHATDLIVTSDSDSGPGSLRDTISLASVGDTILFSLAPSTVITLSSQLEVTKSLVISGPGESLLTISGNNATRVLTTSTGITLSLSGVTIADGNASGYGGGIYNSANSTLFLTSTRFYSNTATLDGGGISNRGALTITKSTLTNNRVTSSTLSNGCAGGGAICNYTSSATAAVLNSTLINNTAGVTNIGGGGIATINGTVTISNTTFYSNSSTYVGGAIAAAGPVSITNSTIFGNSASTSGGGIIVAFGNVVLRNTIVAASPSGGNCFGSITNGGNNIEDGTTCGWLFNNGSKSDTNPWLGPLADNGGPTLTMALLAGSPAINGVIFNTPNRCPPTDQRGATRPIGPRCDIGAYESGYLFLPLILK
jgi:hypothetical protein